MIDVLGLARGESEWESFQGALEGLGVRGLKGFRKSYRAAMETLACRDLVEPGGYRPVGDDAMAFRAAIVGSGREWFESVVSAEDPVEVDVDHAVGLDLDEFLQQVYEEVTEEEWFDTDWAGLTEIFGRVRAQLVGPRAPGPFITAVEATLGRLESSAVYSQGAGDQGFVHVNYLGGVRLPPWGTPGTKWKARRSEGALIVDFTIDDTEFDGAGAAE